MKYEEMKERLLSRFDGFQIGQNVWLQTHRTTDIDELTPEELKSMYELFFPSKEEQLQKIQEQNRIRELRSIVLKEAQYLGLYTPNSWERFNRFMTERSPLKKRLTAYKESEFPVLIKQLKSMRTKFDQSAKQIGTKEWSRKFGLPEQTMN